MNNMLNVTIESVIDALQARYDDVKQHCGCDASESLWKQVLGLVEECGSYSNITSTSAYVDNYLINGEFVSKNDDAKYWIKNTSFANVKQDEIDLDDAWQEYCQDNALIYNDEYACLTF